MPGRYSYTYRPTRDTMLVTPTRLPDTSTNTLPSFYPPTNRGHTEARAYCSSNDPTVHLMTIRHQATLSGIATGSALDCRAIFCCIVISYRSCIFVLVSLSFFRLPIIFVLNRYRSSNHFTSRST